MYVVYGRRFKIIIPAIILVVAYTGTTASVSIPTSDIYFILVVGIFLIIISSKVLPGADIFHVETRWVTAYFSLTMATNILLSGMYIYNARILMGLHAFRCDRITDFYGWQPSARFKFEAALANHIHTHRELRTVYRQYHCNDRDFPQQFLRAMCGDGFDCPDGRKCPIYLASDCDTNLHLRSREFLSLLSCFRFGSMSAPQIAPVSAAIVIPR